MSKLICTLDNRVIGEYALNKERITIGRRQNNDIIIDNLAVSGLHAHITTIGKDSVLEDANSTNGTFINLKPVRKQVLNHQDVIEIGRHQFKYIQENVAVAAVEDRLAGSTPLDKTPNTQPPSLKSLIQMSRPMKPEDEQLSQTTPLPTSVQKSVLPIAKLLILSGDSNGSALTLSKTMTTLGKEGEQRVVITKRTNGYFLSQVEGHEQASINGAPLNVLSYGLKDHDVLEVSGIRMEFSYG